MISFISVSCFFMLLNERDYYLHSGLSEADPHGDLLAHENVWIVGLAEAPFQLVELRRREPGPVSLLLVWLAGVVTVGPAAGGRDSRGRC